MSTISVAGTDGSINARRRFKLLSDFNGNAVLQQSQAFGNWQQPQGVLVGRNMKFSVQYDF